MLRRLGRRWSVGFAAALRRGSAGDGRFRGGIAAAMPPAGRGAPRPVEVSGCSTHGWPGSSTPDRCAGFAEPLPFARWPGCAADPARPPDHNTGVHGPGPGIQRPAARPLRRSPAPGRSRFGRPLARESAGPPAWPTAPSPDGEVTALARDNEVLLRQADGSVKPLGPGKPLALAFAPGGKRLATAGPGPLVRTWDYRGSLLETVSLPAMALVDRLFAGWLAVGRPRCGRRDRRAAPGHAGADWPARPSKGRRIPSPVPPTTTPWPWPVARGGAMSAGLNAGRSPSSEGSQDTRLAVPQGRLASPPMVNCWSSAAGADCVPGGRCQPARSSHNDSYPKTVVGRLVLARLRDAASRSTAPAHGRTSGRAPNLLDGVGQLPSV